MKQKMMDAFSKYYGDNRDTRVFFAPGRVNLIGEHTDYNGGHVFPCALTNGTYLAIRKNHTKTCRFISLNFENLGIIETDLNQSEKDSSKEWTNYPMAVVNTLCRNGFEVSEGFDAVYFGTIPNSSGLSSSASIEVVTAVAMRGLFGFTYDNVEIAKLTQIAENKFIGVNCGIMDQFAIAMGKKDQAIFLDTNTLHYEYATVKLENAKIVIGNTNKKRGLGDSKYNERRSECEAALEKLKTVVNINALGELDEKKFEEVKAVIADEIKEKRAKHAVYENQRTIKAVDVLKNNDIEEFGRLMNASHTSLRDDYEVTGKELDTLVESAWKQQGVIGARMTGAGFGGCSVAIVKDEFVDEFIKNVGREYEEKIGYPATFYIAEIGDGPVEL